MLLSDFSAKLETFDENSILFHYPRGDFQKWIQDALGDEELANRMCFIQRDISGEAQKPNLENNSKAHNRIKNSITVSSTTKITVFSVLWFEAI